MSKGNVTGIGKGHGSNTANLAAIREVPNADVTLMEPGTKGYRMGQCRIFVSPPFNGEGWHLSISCRERMPTWDEVAKARYELLPPDATFAMLLPPPSEYVNLHSFCFHLHELKAGC